MSNSIIVKPLPFASVSASSTAAGYDPTYIGNDHMGVVWKSEVGAATRTITVDMGSDVRIDAALLLGCTGADANWTLKVQAATAAQGSSFGQLAYDSGDAPFLAGSAAPVSGRGRALWLPPSAAAIPAARYWRFVIGGLGAGAATIGRLVLGRRLQLARNIVYGAAFGVRDLGSLDFSRRGVLLRQRGKKLRTISATYPAASRVEAESYIHPLLEEVGNTGPIALILDPDPDAQRQNRIWFGPMIGDIGTVWQTPAGFEWRGEIVDLGA